MEGKRYSEEELIDPALFEIYRVGGTITTSDLIKSLIKVLDPQGEDAEILFGRKDTRFSQKVRNLISHKKIYPRFVDYDSNLSTMTINKDGEQRLFNSEYYLYNQNKLSDVYAETTIDEDLSCDDYEDNNFDDIQKKYVECEPANYSVYELKRRYDRTLTGSNSGAIILNDSFQRNNVWNSIKKSQLIESLLLGIPIPYIYVYEGKNNSLIVIDGRQRLSAIFEFLDNKYPLKGLEFLTNLNGRKCKDLTNNLIEDLEKYKAKLEDAHLHLIRVGFETSEIFKLQIFKRVNQGGIKLNNQELRHALHQGPITEMLKKLSEELDILSLSAKNRMKDRYLMLRYIAMRLYIEGKLKHYDGNFVHNVEYNEINTFLSEAMEAINTFSDEQIDEIEVDFLQSYADVLKYLGQTAFRLENNSPINMILFEVSLTFASLARKNKIGLEKLTNMLEDFRNFEKEKVDKEGNTPFFQNIKYHRDSRENFEQRIKWLKTIIAKYKG